MQVLINPTNYALNKLIFYCFSSEFSIRLIFLQNLCQNLEIGILSIIFEILFFKI